MSSISSSHFDLSNIVFWVIIGVIFTSVIYAIRNTCIDIVNCNDDFVITPSANRSTGGRRCNQNKLQEDVSQQNDRVKKGFQDV